MKFILLLAAILLLAGCDYDTPLTEKPTRAVDPALIGSWFSIKNGEPLDIYRLSGEEYLAIAHGGDPVICTHSDIDGVNFVSCRNVGHDAEYYGKYSYRAYKIEGDQLTIWELNGAIGNLKDMPASERRARVREAVKKGNALDPADDKVLRYRKKS